MNPPAAIDSDGPPTPRGYGARLRTVREQSGLTIDQVAQQLKLAPRQVQAIESEDLALLPEVTYIRGFVRNYARLLRIDAGELLDELPVNGVEPAQGATFKRSGARMAELPPDSAPRAGWARWVIPLLLLAAVVGFTGYEWLRQQARQDEAANAASGAPSAPAESQPALPSPQTLPLNPTVVPEGGSDPSKAPGALPADASSAAPQSAPSDGSASAVTADATGSVGNPPSTGGDPVAREPGPATTVADKAAAPGPPGEVRLSFADTSWVEIRDGRGRVLQSQTNPAGSTHVVTGDPPFALVIGNANKVKVAFNGKPVDLAPYIRANIARLSLE